MTKEQAPIKSNIIVGRASKKHNARLPNRVLPKKHSLCKDCALFDREMLVADTKHNPDILFIAPYPNMTDIKYFPFASKDGSMFRAMVEKYLVGIPKVQQPRVMYSFALHCPPKDPKGVKVNTYQQCAKKVLHIIQKTN